MAASLTTPVMPSDDQYIKFRFDATDLYLPLPLLNNATNFSFCAEWWVVVVKALAVLLDSAVLCETPNSGFVNAGWALLAARRRRQPLRVRRVPVSG